MLPQRGLDRPDIPYRHCMAAFSASARSGETSWATMRRPKSTATPAPFAVMIRPSRFHRPVGYQRPFQLLLIAGEADRTLSLEHPRCPRIDGAAQMAPIQAPRFFRLVQRRLHHRRAFQIERPRHPAGKHHHFRRRRIQLRIRDVRRQRNAVRPPTTGPPTPTVTTSSSARRRTSTTASASISSKPMARNTAIILRTPSRRPGRAALCPHAP